MRRVSSTLGSPISIFWKRRARALSLSRWPRYSSNVVAPTHRSLPEASAGLSRVDEEHAVRLVGERLEHRLQTVLEIAAVARPGDERAKIQGEHSEPFDGLRDLPFDDALREAFDDRRLADPGVSDQERVVLTTATQNVDRPHHLVVATDERVDAAEAGLLVEVRRERLERVLHLGGVVGVVAHAAVGRGHRANLVELRRAVRDVRDDVEARDAELPQEGHARGVLLGKERDEDVLALELLLPRRLHVHGCAPHHPLEAERQDGGVVLVLGDLLDLGVEVGAEQRFQFLEVGSRVAEDLLRLVVERQRVQEVLDGDELVPPPLRLTRGQTERNFHFGADSHRSSLGFGGDEQRHAVLTRELHHLVDLRLCNITRVDSGHPLALVVDAQHDLRGLRLGPEEELHEDEHDELHRRVVVVVEEHLEAPRLLDLGAVLRGRRAFLLVV
jgi:hypothetical protein